MFSKGRVKMKYLIISIAIFLILSSICFSSQVIEKDKVTNEILCSYDTKSTDGKVHVDLTRNVYVDGVLQNQGQSLEEKVIELQSKVDTLEKTSAKEPIQ